VPKDEKYKSLISGREKGVVPLLARKALSGLSALYRVGMESRNLLYSRGLINQVSLPVSVISVGNITVGGTGKTPLVEYIARHFTDAHKKVVILSRGYGSQNGAEGRNDEAAVLDENLPGVPHVQARNRVLAGLRAIREFSPDCIVLDDGFQYRRLKRNLDIVVVDATNPFGYGHLLPRGLLREPVDSLKRAGAVVISKVDEAPADALNAAEKKISGCVSRDCIFRARHKPCGVFVLDGREKHDVEPASLKGKRVIAFCGIGSPESFRRSVEALGCEIVKFQSYPDHYNYSQESLADLRKRAEDSGSEILITTQKDAVKLAAAGLKLHVLKIAFEFVEGGERFHALLDGAL
jgi:tetraacyldisaccharide 4'-kinase